MVVEASNYEAWKNSGSPVYNTTTQSVNEIQSSICGKTTYDYTDRSIDSDAAAWCQDGIWEVVGADGKSGVRGRVASQLNMAGAGFTQPNIPFPTHHYIGDNMLYASDVNAFTAANSDSCTKVDSSSPCGQLNGNYDDDSIGGDYGPYGQSSGYGTWEAISADQMHYNFNHPAPSDSGTVASFLESKGYVKMPTGVIFTTHNKFTIQPLDVDNKQAGASFDAIAFTDTGFNLQHFTHGYYDDHIAEKYVTGKDTGSALMIPNSDHKCDQDHNCHFIANPNLPSNNNNNFYAKDVMLKTYGKNGDNDWVDVDDTSAKTGDRPGWKHSNAAKQFRLPVIEDLTKISCVNGLSTTNPGGFQRMCSCDYYAWLDLQVPPSPAETSDDRGGCPINNALVNSDSATSSSDNSGARGRRFLRVNSRNNSVHTRNEHLSNSQGHLRGNRL